MENKLSGGQKCKQGDKLGSFGSSQSSVLDYSRDNRDGEKWINSEYILEFLLTELTDELG